MEEINKKIENIDDILSIIPNNEKEQFLIMNDEIFEEIKYRLGILEMNLLNRSFSNEENEKITIYKKKNHLITIKMFPFYWYIYESIKDLSLNQLNDLEKE